MTDKIRLLAVGDAGRPTGFEKIMRHVVRYLNDTGKYDIVIRGIGYSEQTAVRSYPVPVKPASMEWEDPCGVFEFSNWIEEDKPDALFLINDLWNLAGYMTFKPPLLPTIAYFPVDCPNVQWSNALALSGVSEAVSYTKFGATETAIGVRDAVDIFAERVSTDHNAKLEWFQLPKFGRMISGRMDRLQRYQNVANYNIIPHGLETNIFKPMDKAKCRRRFGVPEDRFVISNVGTNQFRKRIDLTLRVFAKLRQTVPDAFLLLHCAGTTQHSLDGWNLGQLVRAYGLTGHVMLSHERHGEVSDQQLCMLYNCADVNINTGGGEGWGLCTMESAACGVPQVVPDWSATRELWTGNGMLLPVIDYRLEPKQVLNTAHAVIDVEESARLVASMVDPAVRQQYADLALAFAAKQLSWERVGEAFDQIIQNAFTELPPAEVSLREMMDARNGELKSEITDWLIQR
jgi:glycosyltransferase involved in cell wall biosynthesis